MTRKNFFELMEKEINIGSETKRIENLFSVEKIYDSKTLQNMANDYFFRNWKYRGTFTSIAEMRNALGLSSENIFTYANHHVMFNIEFFITYLEMIINVLCITKVDNNFSCDFRQAFNSQGIIIKDNIIKCLEKLNQKLYKDAEGRYLIVEKNPAATAVAELVEDKQTALKVIEYNHHALKGNLNRKREILVALGDKFEPLREKLKTNGFSSIIEDDAGYLINCFHIRHNNKDGKNKCNIISAMSNSELEAWYDKTYDMLLFAILADNVIDIKKDIKDFKGKKASQGASSK